MPNLFNVFDFYNLNFYLFFLTYLLQLKMKISFNQQNIMLF